MSDPARTDVPDEHLVHAALADPDGVGGRAAVSELLGRHQRRVYLWCHRYVRDHERALELAQEVLLNAYRSLGSFQGRSRFSSWLFAITRNRCLNAVAATHWTRDDTLDLDEVPARDGRPEAALELAQDEERLRRVLTEHLDETEREALWLLAIERLPVEAITRVLGLDNATGARGLLQRARRKLRAALDREDIRSQP
jgi:RNA polymerase sigma-70 factor (ECF subfamily)